jgi:NADH dehydrogenase
MVPEKTRVVIVGGGFGGLYAAQNLKDPALEVTLLDRRNFHLFQPLLYQVATGGLSPGDICSPLRAILNRRKNIRVLLAEVTDLDVEKRRVILSDGAVDYDILLVAAGVRHSYFGHEEWESLAPGLKTVEDAVEIRRRIFLAFEAAERDPDPERRREWLTFVVVGGGPTGVELAGALAELSKDTLKGDFRSINPAEAQILLLEGAKQILPAYPLELSQNAAAVLKRLGVRVRTETLVTEVYPQYLLARSGGNGEKIPSRTVLWAAGVQASSLGRILSDRAGASRDRIGRVIVEPDLSLPGHPEIFVIGDLAHFSHQTGEPLPGVAPVAMQQGRYAARRVRQFLRGESSPPFRYKDRGKMAVIGRAAAVADLNWIRLSGFSAWLVWLFIHLMNLVEYENRVLVLIQWAWNYFTRNRGARLITGKDPFPLSIKEP